VLVPDSPAVVEALARVVLVPVWQLVRDVPTPSPSPRPAPAATQEQEQPAQVPQQQQANPAPAPVQQQPATYYKNCAAVRAAGAAPLHRGQPGYSSNLDKDGDGVACE
ncbi:excalibur calcium-binding domain-containing protein, partial [Propionibacterium freudenreichii]|uniref:excalibur calcium-binding domain-containing protein n=1 Tax=Propionibacterium freudenreichii TaxID=1744 RepID=UPI002550B3F3